MDVLAIIQLLLIKVINAYRVIKGNLTKGKTQGGVICNLRIEERMFKYHLLRLL